MADIALTLGDVGFQGFEIPASIGLSGAQRLAVHRLMSGAQVVDVLGRGDDKIRWEGTLSGSDASSRACALDRMRVAGAPLVLSWDVYSFLVLIEAFEADYRGQWWIPYRMHCAVVQDLSAPVADSAVAPLDSVSADTELAAGFGDVSGFLPLLSQGLTAGTAAYAAAMAAGTNALSQWSAQLTAAGNGISSDFVSSLTACQSMANLAAGQGYLARAVVNLSNLEL
jgi:hypothetical protein